MKKWHLIIDVARCEDCNNCLLACKDEHVDNEWPGYSGGQPRHGHRWMNVARKERGQFPLIDVAYRPTTCMQCADAPCVEAFQGAIQRRDDGLVLIDPEKAKGQRHLAESCPYGMIWWNEKAQVAQKCTLCAHLLDHGWAAPRCVQACPTGALTVKLVDDGEMAHLIAEQKLTTLHPEYGTQPQVFYANLEKFDKCFIAGTVAIENDGTIDCAAGATVALWQGGTRIAEARTDAFGDFKFDGLASKSNWYTVRVHQEGHEGREVAVHRLEESVNVGAICLHPTAREESRNSAGHC